MDGREWQMCNVGSLKGAWHMIMLGRRVTARTNSWVNRFVDCTIEDTKLQKEEKERKGKERKGYTVAYVVEIELALRTPSTFSTQHSRPLSQFSHPSSTVSSLPNTEWPFLLFQVEFPALQLERWTRSSQRLY